MPKTRPNDPCPCNSGKKYKKCHGARGRAPRGVVLKTPDQIAGIHRAGKVTCAILDGLNEIIKPGITTNEIDKWVYDQTRAAGGQPATLGYKGYPKSTCTSKNNVICHGIPNDEPLVDGDLLNVDVTTILDGYFGDSCRMYNVGSVPDNAQRLSDTAKLCLDQAIAIVRPGIRLGDIGAMIQSIAESAGYSVVRDFVGHGVGLAFHEAPQVLHYGVAGTGDELVSGMTFTIEPMINEGDWRCTILDDDWTAVTRDGSLSAQWEHTIAVTDDGHKILTL